MPTSSLSQAATSKALEAFQLNMGDAAMLVELVSLLRNQRTNRMRRELRERLGSALSLPKKDWDSLECLENDDVFLTFKPGRQQWRSKLNDEALKPLLRQAIVVACAAVETYVADRVMELYPPAMKARPIPSRLLGLTMTVDDWLRIDQKYQRKGWGLRQIVELEVRQRSSPTPSVMGELFSMVNQRDLLKRVDLHRKLSKGSSAAQLETIRERRNRIAHQGDRQGRGRATITIREVQRYLLEVDEIVVGMAIVTA
jgi:hypothetical protein